MKRILAGATIGGALFAMLAVLALPASANDQNQPKYWEPQYGDCTKINPGVLNAFVVWGDEQGGEIKTLTTSVTLSAVIVKASTDQEVHEDPPIGTVLQHSEVKGISHVIVCVDDEPPTTQTTQSEPTSTTSSTTSTTLGTTTTTLGTTTTTGVTTTTPPTTDTTKPPVTTPPTNPPTTTPPARLSAPVSPSFTG